MIPILLAHGALGNFDEILFIAVGIVFVALMVFAWMRSRNSAPKPDDKQSPPNEPPAETGDHRPDHFPLA